MKPSWWIATLLMLLLGCGGAPIVPTDAPAGDAGMAEEPEDTMSMEGIDLYLTDTHGQSGVAGKPWVAVHAERFEMIGDGALGLEDVSFRIFGPEGEESLSFTAQRGQFDKDNREAYLEGEVEARSAGLKIDLEDLHWRQPAPGEPSLAETDGPAVLDMTGLHLEAEGLKLRPEEGTFELRHVRGTVSLKGMTP